MTAIVDLTEVRRAQQQTWAAGDYGVVGAQIHWLAESLVEAADLRAGQRVLDVATGTGNAALAAARCNAVVTGLDYVPALLERARLRAAAEGLTLTFVEGDAEDLPFDDVSFDVVTSVVGVMFAADADRAARELVRVCRPGGTIALASWTAASLIGRLLALIARYVPPPPGVASPLAWGDPEAVRRRLGTGITGMRAALRTFRFRYRSAAEFVELLASTYGPVQRALEGLGTSEQQALRSDLLALFSAENHADDGTLAMDGEYLEVIAQRA